MSNAIATAGTWLAEQQATYLSETVTYRRGGASVSVAATPCGEKNGLDQQFGILRINEQDWLITAASLVLSAETVEPERNDTIETAAGVVWQVLPTDAEAVARLLVGDKWRIHTKRIDAGG